MASRASNAYRRRVGRHQGLPRVICGSARLKDATGGHLRHTLSRVNSLPDDGSHKPSAAETVLFALIVVLLYSLAALAKAGLQPRWLPILTMLVFAGLVLSRGIRRHALKPGLALGLFVLTAVSALNAVSYGYLPFVDQASRSNLYCGFFILCGSMIPRRLWSVALLVTFGYALCDCLLALYAIYFDYFLVFRILDIPFAPEDFLYAGQRARRAMGFSLNPISTAFFGHYVAIFCGALLCRTRRYAYLLCIGLLIGYGVCLLSQSRLYFLATSAVLVLLIIINRSRVLLFSLLISVIVVVSTTSLVDADLFLLMRSRWQGIADWSADDSLSRHLGDNAYATELVASRLTGYGPGYASVSRLVEGGVWTESTWLKLAVEEGILFAVVTVVLLLAGVIGAASERRSDPTSAGALLTLALLVVGVSFPVGLYVPNVMLPCLAAGRGMLSPSPPVGAHHG